MIIESVLVFAGELAILLALVYWTMNIGAVLLDYMFTIDNRLIQESLSSFYSAAEISNASFSASMVVPPSPHILEVGKKTGYYVWVYPKKEFKLPTPAGEVSSEKIIIKKVTEIPFVHFENENIIEKKVREFDNKKTTVVFIERDFEGNIKARLEAQ